MFGLRILLADSLRSFGNSQLGREGQETEDHWQRQNGSPEDRPPSFQERLPGRHPQGRSWCAELLNNRSDDGALGFVAGGWRGELV